MRVVNASFMPATAEKVLLDSTTGVFAAESASIEKAPVSGAWAVASTVPTVAWLDATPADIPLKLVEASASVLSAASS